MNDTVFAISTQMVDFPYPITQVWYFIPVMVGIGMDDKCQVDSFFTRHRIGSKGDEILVESEISSVGQFTD